MVFSVSSCSDILEKEPKYSLNEKNAITNFNEAQTAIGGVYSTFKGDAWSGSLYTSLATKSGFINLNSANYNMDYTQLNNPTVHLWSNFYKSLNAVNFALKGAMELSAAAIPSESEREALIAEGRCLRAWINTNIFWNYGYWWADDENSNGILYRDEAVNLSNIEKARSTVGESYEKIFEDLDYAIQNLGSFSSSRYVSKEFAKVLKAKILLYRGGYNDTTTELNEALTLVNDVLESSTPGFSMQGDLAQVYLDSWDSPENLFTRYLDDNGTRTFDAGREYSYSLVYNGNRLPLLSGTPDAGLSFGLDWFEADSRWNIATGPVNAPEYWDNSFYYTWKKVSRLGFSGGRQASPQDEKYTAYYFRYPELYIMKAELLARTGATISDAIMPINTMRSMRTNPVLPSLAPVDQAELMNLIFQEYFLETFLENGSEFFAALRFDNAGKPWIETIKEGKALEENKICYPIPNSEIVNNQLMKQNPGLE